MLRQKYFRKTAREHFCIQTKTLLVLIGQIHLFSICFCQIRLFSWLLGFICSWALWELRVFWISFSLNYFFKKFYFKCLTEVWIRLWNWLKKVDGKIKRRKNAFPTQLSTFYFTICLISVVRVYLKLIISIKNKFIWEPVILV